jgi:hypothetical protein
MYCFANLFQKTKQTSPKTKKETCFICPMFVVDHLATQPPSLALSLSLSLSLSFSISVSLSRRKYYTLYVASEGPCCLRSTPRRFRVPSRTDTYISAAKVRCTQSGKKESCGLLLRGGRSEGCLGLLLPSFLLSERPVIHLPRLPRPKWREREREREENLERDRKRGKIRDERERKM